MARRKRSFEEMNAKEDPRLFIVRRGNARYLVTGERNARIIAGRDGTVTRKPDSK